MTKPTADQLATMLEKLAFVADICIPSDGISNSTLADADNTIQEAYRMLKEWNERENTHD